MKRITTSRHVIVGGATATLLMSAALAGCSAGAAAAAPADAAEPVAVTVAPVVMTDVASAIDSGGVVQARTTATITARILAPVREVRVSPGDQVRTGQTLIVLDGDDLAAGARAARSAARAAEQGSQAAAAELQAAEAGLALARVSHDRIATLQSRRSATPQELDDATATLRSAEARVAGASARVLQAASAVESARAASDQASTTAAFTTIAAPFDGTVTEKVVEPGNMASPGLPLLRLEDTRGFRLEVRVDESRIGQIGHGDSVPVFLGTGTTSIKGTVVEVSRAVEADARAFLVKNRLARCTWPAIRCLWQGAIRRDAAACVDHSLVGDRAPRTAHVGLRGGGGRRPYASGQRQGRRSAGRPVRIGDGDSVAAGRRH